MSVSPLAGANRVPRGGRGAAARGHVHESAARHSRRSAPRAARGVPLPRAHSGHPAAARDSDERGALPTLSLPVPFDPVPSTLLLPAAAPAASLLIRQIMEKGAYCPVK